jgi:hypothetical protein
MALVHCSECNREISDQASACPGCGHPLPQSIQLSAVTAAVEGSAPSKNGWVKWIFIVPVGLFIAMMIFGKLSDPDGAHAAARLEKKKGECSLAMMSSIGHSTVGFADKAAYDALLRDKCDGLSINGVPVVRP